MRRGGLPGIVGESIAISWTVVIVLPSSGTLTFIRLDKEPVHCQNSILSGNTAVSLSEVGDRPTDRAASLSVDELNFVVPSGLLDDGRSWYSEAVDWVRFAKEGLLAKGALGSWDSLIALILEDDF